MKKRRPFRKKDRFFRLRRALSLIEVVLAIVILGLAVPPLIIQMAAGVRQQAALAAQQNLDRLAAERLWEIFADQANPARGYAYVSNQAYPAEANPDGLDGYTRVTTIREVGAQDYLAPQAGSGLKRLRITVTGPGERTVSLESFVADLGSAAQ